VRDGQIGEEPGHTGVENGHILSARLVAERAGEPALAQAARPGQEQIAALGDPFAGGDLEEERAVEPARTLIVDVLDVGRVTQPRTPARRPANSRLDNEKLRRIYGLELPDWRKSCRWPSSCRPNPARDGRDHQRVIWLSDLRGFTSLSESSPPDELIEMLNRYFGPMCDAVEASGGEVLKFIGDSVLAIFPIELDAAAACRRALEAAHAAGIAIEAENLLRTASGVPKIDYGLALHVGDVMYGNIGGDARLDFTVIGPAVNVTSRIESMCKDLQRSPLLSAEFVRASAVRAELLGEFALKGVGARQPIYGVIE
jgi:class 3 adenylate cyclase